MTAKDFQLAVIQKLTPALGEGESRSVVRLLLEDLVGWRLGQRDRELADDELETLTAASKRLLAGEPLQYITGRADFFGLALEVSPAVLIPRPETEELVEWVLEYRRQFPGAPAILDIGTGSGCIPLAIKNNWPQAQVFGLDVSEAALGVAEKNATTLNLEVDWLANDILDAAQWSQLPEFDIIISNPPYIPHREADLMPESVIKHEPNLALFVTDEDSLLFYRTIQELAQQKLKPDGLLFFECNEFNTQDVDALGKAAGFHAAELRQDLQGKWRMWKGRQAPGKNFTK